MLLFQIQQIRLHGREDAKAKEDEMWAIQTGITVLKRRHRALLDEQQQKQQQKGGGENDGEVQKDANAANHNADDDGTSIGSADESINSALLEKQLLAVQMALCEEIREEKRKIAHLLSVLREMRNQLPENDQNRLTHSQRADNDESQHLPTSNKVIRNSNNHFIEGNGGGDGGGGGHQRSDGDKSQQSSGNWEELCQQEESRREQLLAELIRYRKICAQLRARLEHDTMLVKLKRQQEQRPIGGGGGGDLLMPIPIAAAGNQNQQKPQQQLGEAEDVAPLAITVEETAAPKLAADPNDPANLLVTRF